MRGLRGHRPPPPPLGAGRSSSPCSTKPASPPSWPPTRDLEQDRDLRPGDRIALRKSSSRSVRREAHGPRPRPLHHHGARYRTPTASWSAPSSSAAQVQPPPPARGAATPRPPRPAAPCGPAAVNRDNAFCFEGAKEGQLLIQRCARAARSATHRARVPGVLVHRLGHRRGQRAGHRPQLRGQPLPAGTPRSTTRWRSASSSSRRACGVSSTSSTSPPRTSRSACRSHGLAASLRRRPDAAALPADRGVPDGLLLSTKSTRRSPASPPILRGRATIERVKEAEARRPGSTTPCGPTLAEADLLGLGLPEDVGGSGGGLSRCARCSRSRAAAGAGAAGPTTLGAPGRRRVRQPRPAGPAAAGGRRRRLPSTVALDQPRAPRAHPGPPPATATAGARRRRRSCPAARAPGCWWPPRRRRPGLFLVAHAAGCRAGSG